MEELQIIIDKYIQEYNKIIELADNTFQKVQNQFPDAITCHDGCTSCCHAPFDLSVIEALALQKAFKEHIPYGGLRSAIVNAASDIERELTKQKRYFYQLSQEGYTQQAILDEAAKMQLRCPLLGVEDSCLLYEFRPITCRLYGIPTLINSKTHVCGQSKFEKNKAYPTVDISKIQDRLSKLSYDLQKEIKSQFAELYLVYVPLSTVMTTSFDATWLGIKRVKNK